MLDLIHENEVEVLAMAQAFQELLKQFKKLTILKPEVGEEELIKAVAAELARLRALARSG